MKHKLLLVAMAVLCLLPKLSSAQSPDANLKKYWENRDRLRKFFVKIGPNQGESIPANIRDRTKNNMRWSDATSQLGWYIAVLATEYELLKRDNLPTQATLNELYYAINAIKRLDKFGEFNYAKKLKSVSNISPMENGWFIRDDVDSTFNRHWGTMGMVKPHSDYFNKDADPIPNAEHFQAGNEPSVDQMVALLLGFRFVQKYVGDVFVNPQNDSTGFYLFTEVKNMTKRMRDRLLIKKFNVVNEFTPNNDGLFIQQNYTFNNPIFHWETTGGHDRFIMLLAYPLMTVVEAITGEQVNCSFRYTRNSETDPNFEIIDEISFQDLKVFYDDIIIGHEPCLEVGISPLDLTIACFDETFDNYAMNMRMVLMLEAVGRMSDYQKIVDFSEDRNLMIYPLMSNVMFNQQTNALEREFYKALLDSMPLCHGCFLYTEDETPADSTLRGNGGNYWSFDNRWMKNEAANHDWSNAWIKGNQPGLDYMILYNLFHLSFDQSQNLPTYTPEVICPCASSKFHEISNARNNGFWDGLTELIIPETNVSTLTIERKIRKYDFDSKEHGINFERYLNKNLIIQGGGGKLTLFEDVKVCNNSTVEMVLNGARIQVGHNDDTSAVLRFASGTKLILKAGTNLDVLANSRVIIEKGATLQFHPNANIDLKNNNSVLDIRGTLELMPNAVFSTKGNGYVLFDVETQDKMPNVLVNGNNCQMVFTDSLKRKRIEIASHTRLHPPKNLKLFKIEGITAELGLNASMVLPCDFHIVNNTITRIPTVTDNNGNTRVHKGITIYGILHPQYITDNTFSDAKTAFTILNPQGHYDIKIHYNDFINCDYGVQVRNGRTHVFANEFTDCGQAVQAVDFARTLRFESNTVKGAGNNPTGFGFEITSANYADVGITGNVFSKTVTGFHGDKAVATLACNHFFQNDQAIDFYNYGSLNISAAVPSTGISLVGGSPLNGGYNYLNIPSGKNGAKVTSPYGLLRPFFLTTQIDNGYNSFYNVGSSNPQHSSLVITRPSNTLNTSIQDLTINNNYWGPQANVAYVAPPLPPNFISVNNAGSIHFAINENYTPRYILGIQSATTTTCPISAWTSALSDPLNFDPDTKKPPVGGGATLNIYRNGSVLSSFDGNFGGISTTENVPNGTYMGTNVKTAFRNVFTGFTQTVPLSGGGSEEVVLKQGLLNLANLLTATSSLISPETKEMNVFGYQKYLASIGDAIGAQVFVGDAAGVANQLLAANTLFDQLNTVNDAVNINDTPHYRVKFNIELDRMIVHWMFGKYADALEINSDISTFVQTDDIDRLNYWNCIIENERKVIAEEITELEYAENIKNCAMLFPYQPLQGYGLNGGSQGGGGSSEPNVTYTLTPNPATDVITVNMDMNVDGDVRLAVFNKFGIKVVNDKPLGELLAGNHSHTVAIAGLPIDVYNMVVYVDNVPFVEHFIKNNE